MLLLISNFFCPSLISLKSVIHLKLPYLHLLLHKPVVIKNIVHLNRTSRETSFWKTGALKPAVSKVSVKENGVRPSTLVCNLVLFVRQNSVIIHITLGNLWATEHKHQQFTAQNYKFNCFFNYKNSKFSTLLEIALNFTTAIEIIQANLSVVKIKPLLG